MKKRTGLLLAGMMFAAGGVAEAQDLTVADALKDVKINGFLSGGYNYNFNEPYNRAVNLRPFNDNHDNLSLELAQLVFHKDAIAAGDAGFRLDLNFGYTVPQSIHSTGYTPSDDFDIRQAYASYVAPLGNGLKLDFGKFITEMGAEVIEGYEDWNWNYSRSFLFYFSIPFTHTGVRAIYPVNDKLTLLGEVVNGWDNVTDNNNGKTICLHAAVMPVKDTTVNIKYMVGAEQADNNNNQRHLFNLNLTTAINGIVFKADYVYGAEENVPGTGDATWTGLAGYVRYPVTDKFAINGRAEFFNDDDGTRTGTRQDLWEITLTPEYALNENLLVRAEYRHDSSNEDVFDKKDGKTDRQETLGMNVIYHF